MVDPLNQFAYRGDFAGHPYMELQRVDRKQVEFLPDWILEPTLKIDKTATSNISRAKASKHWSKKLGATQVHCLDDSSDDSDCCKSNNSVDSSE